MSRDDPDLHPHLLLAHKLWEAIAAGDAGDLRWLLSEKTVWHMPGRSPIAGTYEGVAAVIGLLARVGDLTDELRSDLLDVFVSDRGAVMRYAVHAYRGVHHLETEHLFLIQIENGQVSQARFVPIDQLAYDAFFTPQ
jgi:ketosteroid isomerase-like protein